MVLLDALLFARDSYFQNNQSSAVRLLGPSNRAAVSHCSFQGSPETFLFFGCEWPLPEQYRAQLHAEKNLFGNERDQKLIESLFPWRLGATTSSHVSKRKLQSTKTAVTPKSSEELALALVKVEKQPDDPNISGEPHGDHTSCDTSDDTADAFDNEPRDKTSSPRKKPKLV